MSPNQTNESQSFLDVVARIFRGRQEAAPPEVPSSERRVQELEERFGSAVSELNEKVAALRQDPALDLVRAPATEEEAKVRADARAARLTAIHEDMRRDIERMHAQFETGIKDGNLDDLAVRLRELQEIVDEGRTSHDLVPRARYAIAERVRAEAGELAVERLQQVLTRASVEWPDVGNDSPQAPPEELERSRRRRLTDRREAFLAQDFARTAQRALGIVHSWGVDYPSPGSNQWEECALVGIGAGLRAQLIVDIWDVLTADPEAIVDGVEEMVGAEISALRDVIADGVRSIEQANVAVAGAMRAIDAVAPDIAWRIATEKLPRARGEWDD